MKHENRTDQTEVDLIIQVLQTVILYQFKMLQIYKVYKRDHRDTNDN